MRNMNTKALVEASLLSALAAVIIIASVYIPILSIVGAFIWPVPITLLSFKYDIKTGILSLVTSLAIAAMVTTPIEALTLGLSYGLTAVVLGYCLRKKYTPFITIMAMAVATFAGYVAVLKLTLIVTGVDPIKDFYTMVDESIKKSIEIAKSLGTTEEQLKSSPITNMTSANIKMIFPGVMALASVTGSFMTYYFVEVIFKKLRITIEKIKPFSEWYLGSSFGLGLLSMTLFSMVLVFCKVPNANIVYTSMVSVVGFAFEVVGLSIVIWFLKLRGVPKGFLILIGVFLLFSRLGIVLFFLGMADYIMDFRKINPARRGRISPKE